jgi:hypothetical protein
MAAKSKYVEKTNDAIFVVHTDYVQLLILLGLPVEHLSLTTPLGSESTGKSSRYPPPQDGTRIFKLVP